MIISHLLQDHPYTAYKNWVHWIDLSGILEVLLGSIVLTHLFIDLANTVHRIVMARICCHCGAVAHHSFVIFFIADVFMALESEGIGKLRVVSCGAFEASKSLVVIPLEREAVTKCTPGFRGGLVEFHELMGKERQVNVFPHMP